MVKERFTITVEEEVDHIVIFGASETCRAVFYHNERHHVVDITPQKAEELINKGAPYRVHFRNKTLVDTTQSQKAPHEVLDAIQDEIRNELGNVYSTYTLNTILDIIDRYRV